MSRVFFMHAEVQAGLAAAVERPLEMIDLPPQAARDNLAAQLESQYGHSPEMAALIARAVVDPAAARHQLRYPKRRKVPNGTALFLETTAFSHSLATSLINPRETEAWVARSSNPELGPWPSMDDRDPADGTPLLEVVARSHAHIADQLRASHRYLVDRPTWRDPIREDGVRAEITVVPVRVVSESGDPPQLALMSADGSTRTANTHENTGADPVDVIFRYPAMSARDWRAMLGQIVALQDRPASSITPEQAWAHRSLVVPVRILLGVEPSMGRARASMVTTVRVLVADEHLNTSDPWGPGCGLREAAKAALDQCVYDGLLSAERQQYILGTMSEAEAEENGFAVHADARAAYAVHFVFDDAHSRSISTGFRTVVKKRKLGRQDRPDMAAELFLRPYLRKNPALAERDRRAVISAAERTLNLSELRSASWSVTNRTPEEIRDAAIAELGRESFGPSQLELGVLAAYPMVTQKVLMRDRPTTDDRSGGAVIRQMLRSEHGIRQLYQAVIDGRDGRDIRRIRPDGMIEHAAGGAPMTVTDTDLRTELFPKPAADAPGGGGDDDGPAGGEVPALDPMTRLTRDLQRLREITEEVGTITDRIGALRLSPDGPLVVRDQGVPSDTAQAISATLSRAATRLTLWGETYRENTQDALTGVYLGGENGSLDAGVLEVAP